LDIDFDLKRTHSCGQLRLDDAKQEAVLKGWMDRRRDLGGLIEFV